MSLLLLFNAPSGGGGTTYPVDVVCALAGAAALQRSASVQRRDRGQRPEGGYLGGCGVVVEENVCGKGCGAVPDRYGGRSNIRDYASLRS